MSIAACTGTGSINSASDLGLVEPADRTAPLPPPARPGAVGEPEITTPQESVSQLPNGPRDTGTFPQFGDEPAPRIGADSQAEANRLLAEMAALNAAVNAGKISSAQYNQRLAALRVLAANHSDAMLQRIEGR